VKGSSSSVMIEVLAPIWRRVLQQPSIGVEDNFFELGGDSSSAAELFNEIAKECGRELPPVMIYQAPTIASLAAVLEQPTAPRLPVLVPLKAGTEMPPVFIAHGLGGSAIDFFQPVRHIESQHPIYGMQARGFDGVEKPFERIEDMAQFFLDAIKKLQPRGPYLLMGFSLGGLVTLEMAQRLSENGEKVALLALLETYPHATFLPLGQRARLSVRMARRQISTAMRMPMRKALSSVNRNSGSPSYVSRDGSRSAQTIQRVRESAYLALKRYRPRYYKGKIKFVGAKTISDFPDDPVAVWANLAEEFEVETVPGDHLGIITTHFEALAAVLSRYLREACPKEKG
jgi:thioesterase domain-containing protein/acyl carrier protein